jgi:hypothetical protein
MKKVFCLLAIFFAVNSSAQIVERLEPAQWWVGMYYSEVQLMLHGEKIADCSVKFVDNKLKINRIEKTDNPNYLFVYVETKNAQAGEYFLSIEKAKAVKRCLLR